MATVWYLTVEEIEMEDVSTYGPFKTIDEAIAEWHKVCKREYEDSCEAHLYLDTGVFSDSSGTVRGDRLTLEFLIEVDVCSSGILASATFEQLVGDIYCMSSDSSEPPPEYEWLKAKLEEAVDVVL